MSPITNRLDHAARLDMPTFFAPATMLAAIVSDVTAIVMTIALPVPAIPLVMSGIGRDGKACCIGSGGWREWPDNGNSHEQGHQDRFHCGYLKDCGVWSLSAAETTGRLRRSSVRTSVSLLPDFGLIFASAKVRLKTNSERAVTGAIGHEVLEGSVDHGKQRKRSAVAASTRIRLVPSNDGIRNRFRRMTTSR